MGGGKDQARYSGQKEACKYGIFIAHMKHLLFPFFLAWATITVITCLTPYSKITSLHLYINKVTQTKNKNYFTYRNLQTPQKKQKFSQIFSAPLWMRNLQYTSSLQERKKSSSLFHSKIMLPMHIFITEQNTQQTKQK